MKLIKGERNRCPLEQINQKALNECDEVWAAVAYVTDDQSLIIPCYEKKIPLKLWARYDYTVPVNVSILEWFLGKSPLSVCKLIQDIFHPKVIWWRPYGAYIGSANLTKSAWGGNFEAGLFLSEDELDDHGIKSDLEKFFEEIDDSAHLLSRELVEEFKTLQTDPHFAQKEQFRREFDKKRQLPRLDSLLSIKTRSNAGQRKQQEFLHEWNQTLTYIRDIADKLSESGCRPKWVHDDVPNGVHADQFLHAYYYNKVMEKHTARHRVFHEDNKGRSKQALEDAVMWWSALQSAPSSEDKMMHEYAPLISGNLAESRIEQLNEDEFVEVFSHVHAFRNYADRASYKTLGLQQKLPGMTSEQRGDYLARRLFSEYNESGESILALLKYLLYDGESTGLPQRLYEVSFNSDRAIRYVGLSTFGEVVGWALPKHFPPRNGRTSKALYALGYDVKIHTE